MLWAMRGAEDEEGRGPTVLKGGLDLGRSSKDHECGPALPPLSLPRMRLEILLQTDSQRRDAAVDRGDRS